MLGTSEIIIVALMGAVLLGRRILEQRGYKILTADEKVRLMDGLSDFHTYSLIPAIFLVFGMPLMRRWVDHEHFGYVLPGMLLVFFVVHSVLYDRKVKSLGMPREYMKYFTASRLLLSLGMCLPLLFLLLLDKF